MRSVFVLVGVGILLMLGAIIRQPTIGGPCAPGACGGPTQSELLLYGGLALIGVAAIRLLWVVTRARTR